MSDHHFKIIFQTHTVLRDALGLWVRARWGESSSCNKSKLFMWETSIPWTANLSWGAGVRQREREKERQCLKETNFPSVCSMARTPPPPLTHCPTYLKQTQTPTDSQETGTIKAPKVHRTEDWNYVLWWCFKRKICLAGKMLFGLKKKQKKQ